MHILLLKSSLKHEWIFTVRIFYVDFLDFGRTKKQNKNSSNVWGVGNYSSVLISPTTVLWKKTKKINTKNENWKILWKWRKCMCVGEWVRCDGKILFFRNGLRFAVFVFIKFLGFIFNDSGIWGEWFIDKWMVVFGRILCRITEKGSYVENISGGYEFISVVTELEHRCGFKATEFKNVAQWTGKCLTACVAQHSILFRFSHNLMQINQWRRQKGYYFPVDGWAAMCCSLYIWCVAGRIPSTQ